MGKTIFMNYIKFTREFNLNRDELQKAEWPRYKSIAEKHGLKILTHGTPWGNDYHWMGILESEKGVEAWDAFTSEYLANGTPHAWKYIKDFKTNVMSALE